jgi:hypothetical protein
MVVLHGAVVLKRYDAPVLPDRPLGATFLLASAVDAS